MKYSELTDKHVVWCDTEEKAEMLCKFMDSLGLSRNYLDDIWCDYKKETCYNPIKRTYGDKEWAEKYGCIIISFDDLELDGMFGQVTSKLETPYWDNITKIFEKQRAKGVKSYGFPLEENNVLSAVEVLEYYQEELIDALMYTEHLKVKIGQLASENAELNEKLGAIMELVERRK